MEMQGNRQRLEQEDANEVYLQWASTARRLLWAKQLNWPGNREAGAALERPALQGCGAQMDTGETQEL